MKTIGLIGGMSWESTGEYYRLINEEVKKRLGGLHSAKCLLYSVDFAEIEQCQMKNNWDKAADILASAAKSLERAGADFLVLCTNTMHKVAPEIEKATKLPLLHIADATAKKIKEHGVKKIGLLGTSYTMEQAFYKERLLTNGIDILIPNKHERNIVNKVIFEELCLGDIRYPSKETYKKIIHDLINAGAEGIILGCTEITLLIDQADSNVPLFDTTSIHALTAVEKALQNK
ncbi:aspartate/glutamate racemase family protein [Bacillus aquiflavi]|uniref:Aspartate/glutamate racemase family protein n=1 Tax=Bacillus aquiflavi TaxID=2672567 RepID=A0A6B3W5C3_9BACI|nr:aspartate/glutamate racemase family protein [Bacillus aquiflavi]MBA4538568.1 aspartate/glutamate racemase family protein [Bacillus aquiflavi]NEY82931.1 aspartate/glutamate racemase family protein [Bacillus aquiflavi]